MVDSKLHWMYPLNDNSDMRIGFELFDPYNRPIVRKERLNSDTHVHTVKEPGVYMFCFDNSHSLSTKIINLELYLYSNQDDDRWGGAVDPNIKFEEELTKYSDSVETLKVSFFSFTISELLLIKIETNRKHALPLSLQNSVNRIRDNLQSVSHSQDARRAIETRDHNLVSSLSRFINFFSVFSMIMIPLVGFAQLMLIRSLFEHKSQLRHLFKPFPFMFLEKLGQ